MKRRTVTYHVTHVAPKCELKEPAADRAMTKEDRYLILGSFLILAYVIYQVAIR